MIRKSLIGWFVVMTAFGVVFPSLAQENTAEFEELVQAAYQTLDRNERAKMLAHALTLRPNHPENISLEYEIAACHAHNNVGRPELAEQRHGALLMFEALMEKYNYAELYVPILPDTLGRPDLLMIRAALRAATMRMFDHQENDLARTHLVQGLDWLYETYQRRMSDWLNAPEPFKPPELTEREENPGDYRRAFMRHRRWAEHRTLAERGDVFIEHELQTTETFVEHFGKTYGRVRHWEVKAIMRLLIERYPDSPIADEAQRQIDRSHEAMRQSGEFEHGGWDSMEQAAEAMQEQFGTPREPLPPRRDRPRPGLSDRANPADEADARAASEPQESTETARVVPVSSVATGPPVGRGWVWGVLAGLGGVFAVAGVGLVLRRGRAGG